MHRKTFSIYFNLPSVSIKTAEDKLIHVFKKQNLVLNKKLEYNFSKKLKILAKLNFDWKELNIQFRFTEIHYEFS